MTWRKWTDALLELFYPRTCVVCGRRLAQGEEAMCTHCNIRLPRTGGHRRRDNEAEQLLWGRARVERAAAYYYYAKGSDYNRIVHHIKYRGRKALAEQMGRMCGRELGQGDFLQGIDLLVPVPLHPARERARGYNQSEYLARGLSAACGIPCCTTLLRRVSHVESQVGHSLFERTECLEGAFRWADDVPARLAGKHILIVDDVLTTGSTLCACLQALPAGGASEGVGPGIVPGALTRRSPVRRAYPVARGCGL